MNFSQALDEMKNGKKIARSHWGGYWFIPEGCRGGELVDDQTGLCCSFSFNRMIVAKLKDNGGYVPATAYQEDLLADDWVVRR